MKFKKAKILVIGDVMIDRYIYGNVERISPEAPVPVLHKNDESSFLGGAGLVVSNLKSLGADVDFIAVVGKDKEYLDMKRLLSEKKIPEDGLICEEGRHTTIKTRFVAASPHFQMLLRLDNETKDDIRPETERKIIDQVKRGMSRAAFVIVSDYNKGVLTTKVIDAILMEAKKSRKKVIVDTKKSLHGYKGSYLVAPNTTELCLAFGLKNTNEDDVVLPNAIRLSKELGCVVVVKRSGKGATIADSHGIRTYPSLAGNVINVSGAGDIFVSILTMALASDQPLNEAVKMANLGCGKAIAKKHPSITPEDLR